MRHQDSPSRKAQSLAAAASQVYCSICPVSSQVGGSWVLVSIVPITSIIARLRLPITLPFETRPVAALPAVALPIAGVMPAVTMVCHVPVHQRDMLQSAQKCQGTVKSQNAPVETYFERKVDPCLCLCDSVFQSSRQRSYKL